MTVAGLTAIRGEGSVLGRVRPYLAFALAALILLVTIWVMEGGLSATDTAAGSAKSVTLTGFAGGVTPRVGEPAPDFSLEQLNGPPLTLSELRGKPIVVNVWASWCPPCRAEMPDLNDLARQHREAGLVVVAVNLQEDRAAVQRYADTLGLTLPIVLDRDGTVSTRYNLTALPTSYFIDRQGNVRDLNIGALTAKGLRTKVSKILE